MASTGSEIRNVIKAAVKFRRIPDKWKDYAPCGKPIRSERLISFKTPLSQNYHYKEGDNEEDSLHKGEEFTPSDLLQAIQENGDKLGLVVDFTNTKRYYTPIELTDRNIEYKKIKCEGKIVPPEKVVSRFKATILSFFKTFPSSHSLVGVHCTHGLNRAGYIVCRYLIDCKGYEPEEAIEAFNEARGHEMERENYIEDLKTRQASLISQMGIDALIRETTFSEDEEPPKQRRDRRNEDGGPYRLARPSREQNYYQPYERPRSGDGGRRRANDERYENHDRERDDRAFRQRGDRNPHRMRPDQQRWHEDDRGTDRGFEDWGQRKQRYDDDWRHSGERNTRREVDNRRCKRAPQWHETDDYYAQNNHGYTRRDY